MGDALEDAGKRSARSFDDAKQAGRDLAIGVGALAGAFAVAARSQQSAEQASRTLTRQYGDEADALRELAEQIQETTNFSNDQAIQAANTFGTLRREYDLTATQLETLIQVSADLATTAGIGLVDASQRVAAAVRGEGESIELLGIVANDASLGIDRMAKTTTNAEKAQIRYTAITSQAAFAQGAAAEAAEGTRGAVFDLAHSVQDAAQDFAAWTGVTGEATAAASEFALELALVGGGVVKLGSGMRSLAGAAGVGRLLPLLAGPGGLVVGAGLAVGVVAELTGVIDLFGGSAQSASPKVDELTASINAIAAAGDIDAARLDVIQFDLEDITARAESAGRQLDILTQQIVQLDALSGDAGAATSLTELWQQLAAVEAQIGDRAGLNDELDATNEALIRLAAASNEPGFDRALANIEALIAGWRRGELTITELLDAIQATVNALPEYNRRVTEAAESTENWTRNLSLAARGQDNWNAAMGRGVEMQGALGTANGEVTGTIEQQQLEANAAAQSQGRWNAAMARGAELEGAMSTGGLLAVDNLGLLVEVHERGEQAAREHNQALIDLLGDIERIDDILLDLGKTMSGEQGLIRVSQDVERSKNQLDSLISVVVGGTNALGQSSSAAVTFITDLTSSTSSLDSALKSGRISQAEYNAVLEAETRILENDAAAQAHLDAIRAKQAPLIAAQADAYEDYVEDISKLPAAEQRIALAFADSGEKAKISTAFATAYAASLGEIPRGVATEMIVNDAKADPVLRDILEKYDLIEVGADGKITVNFPEGETLQETLNTLNDTLRELNDIIATPAVNLQDNASAGLADVFDALDQMDLTSVAATVSVRDNASGTLANLIGNLQFLDGFTATSVVETVQRTRFETIGAGPAPFATGGTVTPAMARHAANGITVGEFGPEFIPNPPIGMQVMPHGASMSRLEAGGGSGRPFIFNNYAPIYGVDDLERAFDRFMRSHTFATGH